MYVKVLNCQSVLLVFWSSKNRVKLPDPQCSSTSWFAEYGAKLDGSTRILDILASFSYRGSVTTSIFIYIGCHNWSTASWMLSPLRIDPVDRLSVQPADRCITQGQLKHVGDSAQTFRHFDFGKNDHVTVCVTCMAHQLCRKHQSDQKFDFLRSTLL